MHTWCDFLFIFIIFENFIKKEPLPNGKKIHQLTSKGVYKDARNLLSRNRFTNLSIGILKIHITHVHLS
jgi:hypothetical protein